MYRLAFGALVFFFGACAERLPVFVPESQGAPLTLVAKVEAPTFQQMSVIPLIEVEIEPCEFGPQRIIAVDGSVGQTVLSTGKVIRLSAVFERRFAHQVSSTTDTVTFLPKAGSSYRAEYTYLDTGYSLRVFENGSLLSKSVGCRR